MINPSSLPCLSLFAKSKMERLSFFVGITANIISVLMFLSPIKTFWRIIKHRSTEDFESLPYICSLLSSSLWTYYGIITPGEFLVAPMSAFGAVLETIYVALFLLYAPTKMRVKTIVLVGILDVGFLAATFLVAQLVLQGEMRINTIGFLSAALNVIMYVSPLAAMKTVVRTKSVEFMPFLLSFFFVLNAGIWTLYAFLVGDYYFLGVTNGAGFVLGIAQLVLYGIYRRPKPLINVSANHHHRILEEGWQRQSLITPN